jgi:hypothetical protein
MYGLLMSIFLAQQALYQYNIILYGWPSMTIKTLMSPFQSQRSSSFYGQSKVSMKHLFLSSSNSKLRMKVAYGLPLSWLLLRVDRPWSHGSRCRSNIACPKQILKSTEPYRVVQYMEALDECFPHQIKLWCCDVIGDVMTKI